jgi:hypothetical protein
MNTAAVLRRMGFGRLFQACLVRTTLRPLAGFDH